MQGTLGNYRGETELNDIWKRTDMQDIREWVIPCPFLTQGSRIS